ncbi:MAG: hypothetical protein C0467_16295 [Planctomycetaceae bacterium]|nr:hypothetical protein [Planctomycetaceae bacterium]
MSSDTPTPPKSAIQTTGYIPNPTPTLSVIPQEPPAAADGVAASTLPSEIGGLLREMGGPASTQLTADEGRGTISQSPAEQVRSAGMSGDTSGTSLPGYEILGELGRGGMGVVYKARQVSLNRIVALKTIRGNRVGPKDLARFLIEAEAVAAIEHPNVVRVYEYGDYDGHPYMALEYLPGGTLGDRIEKAGKLPPLEAAGLIATIARGVAAAHALRIVHRDLKPANVLFGKEESAGDISTAPDATPNSHPSASAPKVADFGLAKRGASDLTQTQAVMGTPAYMAPEQADGRTKFVGPTADVWSLGVILFECLHGDRPFEAPDVHGLLGMIRSAEVPAYDSQSRVPRELDLICRKCLEKIPADRYPSATELADDLERFCRGEPVTVRPLGPTARAARWAKRNPVVAGLVGFVFVVSVGLVASLFAQYKQAVARAEFEHHAKEEAERLKVDAVKFAEENAKLAQSETARRKEAEQLRKQADAEAARANQVSDFMTGLFRGTDPLDFFGNDILPQSWEKQRSKTADTLLKEAAEKFRTGLQDQPLTKARLSEAVANSLTSFGDYKSAEPIFKEALALRRQHLPPNHPDVIENELAIGRMYWNLGDFPAALEWFRGAMAKQRNNGASEEAILACRFYEALALTFIDEPAADVIFREVIEGRDRLLGPNHKDTISARIAFAGTLLDQGRTGELVNVLPKILASLQSHPSAQFRLVGDVISAFQTGVGLVHMANSTPALADSFRRQAETKLREALKKGEQHFPFDHWMVNMIRFELAGVLSEMGKWNEADALYTRMVESIRKTYGFAHPKLLIVGHVVGIRWARNGRLVDARKLWEDIDIANKTQFGADNHWRGKLLLGRATFESEFGSVITAQKYLVEALGLVRAGKVAINRPVCQTLLLAGKGFARPNLSEPAKLIAKDLLATTRQYISSVFGTRSREMCLALRVEGEELFEMGYRAAGLERLTESLAIISLLNGSSDDDERHDLWAALGRAENARGRFETAEGYYAKAFAISRGDWPRDRLTDGWGLVTARVGLRKFAQAIPVLESIRRWNVSSMVSDQELAWTDLCLAAARFTAGDAEEYLADIRGMMKRAEQSTNVNVLARTAWAVGLSPDTIPTEAADLAKLLAAKLTPASRFAWGYWSLALVRLRAGDLEGAENALTAGGTTFGTPPREWAFYPIIKGLCAVKRGDIVAAQAHLRKAEELVAGERPSEARPFAYADTIWADRFFTDLLLAELRAKITPRDVAPPPREVKVHP